jgi:hypothetical protein
MLCVKKNREDRNISDVSEEAVTSFFKTICKGSTIIIMIKDCYIYMRRTAGYIWTDYKTNKQIAKELKIKPILDKLPEYKRNWIQHVNGMPRIRLPRVMKHYSPTGRKNHSRPLRPERVNKWPNSMTVI